MITKDDPLNEVLCPIRLKEWEEVVHKKIKSISPEKKVVIQSRIHNNDLKGHIIEGNADDHGFKFLTLPLDAP